jgi:hypothetical protein
LGTGEIEKMKVTINWPAWRGAWLLVAVQAVAHPDREEIIAFAINSFSLEVLKSP